MKTNYDITEFAKKVLNKYYELTAKKVKEKEIATTFGFERISDLRDNIKLCKHLIVIAYGVDVHEFHINGMTKAAIAKKLSIPEALIPQIINQYK